MYRALTIIIFIFQIQITLSQGIITRANNMIIENREFKDGSLFIYQKGTKLVAGSKCNFKNESVEKLFCDFFNTKSNEERLPFFNSVQIPKTYDKEDYQKNKAIYFEKGNSNYYQLDSKYILDRGSNIKDIYIKYINYNDDFPKPLYSLIYIRKINNEYSILDLGQNFDLGLFLISTKSSVLNDLFANKLSKDNLKVLAPYLHGKTIDLELIMNDYFKFFRENKSHTLYKLLHDETYSAF